MNRIRTIVAWSLAFGLAAFASAQAGSTPPSAVPPTPAAPAPAKAGAVAPSTAAEPQIFLVWHGPPKSFSSGPVYVDAAGHELSRSRKLALEKVAQNAALAAVDHKSFDKHLSGQ